MPKRILRLLRGSRWIAALAVASVIGAGVDAHARGLWFDVSSTQPPRASTLPDFIGLAATLGPAVVNIATVQKEQGAFEPDAGEYSGGSPQHALGSGFIINPDGYIVTDDHVIQESQKIVVTLKDGHQFRAYVVGRDEKTDLALLKINAPYKLAFAPLGNSEEVKVGEWVMAIGNPFGFDHSVTAGIVSAKGRFVPGNYDDFIQTDASINPGNSGGPLIDLSGAVVGVNSAIYTRTGGNTGIGFAIPINLVKQELPQLLATGRVARGWLGVYIQAVTPELARAAGLAMPRGALVSQVLANGPGEAAGLKRGDIVVEYDHHTVSNSQALPLMVGRTTIGSKVAIRIVRGQRAKDLSIVITASREDELTLASHGRSHAADALFGLALKDLSGRLAHELNLESASGVVISSVEPGSPADDAGLRARDVILEVNQAAVKNAAACAGALEARAPDKVVLLLVKRNRNTLFVALKPEE